MPNSRDNTEYLPKSDEQLKEIVASLSPKHQTALSKVADEVLQSSSVRFFDRSPIRSVKTKKAQSQTLVEFRRALDIYCDKVRFNQTNDQEINNWNRRTDLTKKILCHLEGRIENTTFIMSAYYVCGKPVGIVATRPCFLSHIEFLITHPGSKSVGGALISDAVNQCMRKTGHPILSFAPDNSLAMSIGQHFGFKYRSVDNTMRLNVLTSSAWCKEDENDRWCLKSNIGTRFLG